MIKNSAPWQDEEDSKHKKERRHSLAKSKHLSVIIGRGRGQDAPKKGFPRIIISFTRPSFSHSLTHFDWLAGKNKTIFHA